jgi:hypothetical protein
MIVIKLKTYRKTESRSIAVVAFGSDVQNSELAIGETLDNGWLSLANSEFGTSEPLVDRTVTIVDIRRFMETLPISSRLNKLLSQSNPDPGLKSWFHEMALRCWNHSS